MNTNKPEIYADLTRAIPGTENGLVEKAILYAQQSGGASIYLVCFADQQRMLTTCDSIKILAISGPRHWSSVAQMILMKVISSAAARPNDEFQVLSFHPAVLNLYREMPPEVTPRVKFFHWGYVLKFNGGHVQQDSGSMLKGLPLSPESILQTLNAALEKRKRPTRLTDIRALLVGENIAFEDPAFRFPGFITAIIKAGCAAGVIQSDSSQDRQNPWISLKGAVAQVTCAAIKPLNGYQSHAAVNALNGDESHAAVNALNGDQSPQIDSSGPQADASAKTRKSECSRTNDLFALLRDSKLGPFSAVRPVVYDCVEELATKGTFTCNTLIQRTVTGAKAKGRARPDYPWWPISHFLFALFGNKPVLLDDQGAKLNPFSVDSLQKPVVGLVSEWREILDASLLHFLIEADGKIEAFEIPELAAVLYNDRSEESQTKVEALFGRLTRQGEIEIDGRRFKAVAKSGLATGKRVEGLLLTLPTPPTDGSSN